MASTKLNLSSTAWMDLVDFLVNREALRDEDDARTGYTGRGELHHGIAFTVPMGIAAQLRLAAALADAFREIDGLVELAADGYGVDDFLAEACGDTMGRDYIIYFPGHRAQAL